MMSLYQSYQVKIDEQKIKPDEAQQTVIAALNDLEESLWEASKSYWPWAFNAIKGLYIHGSVGSGKTLMMDLFFNHCRLEKKIRVHFHEFMQQVDAKLRALQGHKNPLQVIAKDYAKQARVICFDEFLVHDVAHALILRELLESLLQAGIILVATSNTLPSDLYRGGVQRDRFMLAIKLIEQHCHVMALNAQRDYRLFRQKSLNNWFFPRNSDNRKAMTALFQQQNPIYETDEFIEIQNRFIPYVYKGKQGIWFHFDDLCNVPRSQLDYLELSTMFSSIYVSDVPKFRKNDTIRAILFIHLIDVLYDRGIELIVESDVVAAELYQTGEMSGSFQRTLSRLEEMQSIDYAKKHRH